MNARRPVFATLLMLAALAAGACGGRDYDGPPVILLGFDGMDYGLARRLVDEGRMPNFARLEAEGVFQPLATAVPPQSPVAWSNFITGMDSGGHAIFDFVHRYPEDLRPYLSTSRDREPKKLKLGSWEIPLWGGGVELLRRGTPFWEILEERGVRTHIYRMPANYPPSGSATTELSGMGTPDLLGSPGTFTFFTSDLFAEERKVDGGDLRVMDLWDDRIEGELVGPEGLTATFVGHRDPDEPWLTLEVGEERVVLAEGEWSGWVPVDFELGALSTLHAMARFYVQRVRPEVELYVSPLQIDPLRPAKPISTPESFAPRLAAAGGRFYTQGMPEDTQALSAGVFSYDEFLAQAEIAGREVREQYREALARFEGDFLFYYFGNLDQISHMLFRTLDPQHPAYDAEVDGPLADVLPRLYEEYDEVVGYTLANMPAGARLIVMSDHGFASWRRVFHLNAWLQANGYLAVEGDATSGNLLARADWGRTRAYGLGLNGLYVNLAGREKDGSVSPADYDALLGELSTRLLAVVDPATGEPAVTKVYRRDVIYGDGEGVEVGPDLVVGYAKGTRCSGESAIGDLAAEVFSDNTEPWSGDHCMDHEAVPGILLANQKPARPAADLEELTVAVLAEFGIDAAAGG